MVKALYDEPAVFEKIDKIWDGPNLISPYFCSSSPVRKLI